MLSRIEPQYRERSGIAEKLWTTTLILRFKDHIKVKVGGPSQTTIIDRSGKISKHSLGKEIKNLSNLSANKVNKTNS